MSISRNEHTIATACEVTGTAYWSGNSVSVKMLPASAGTGIVLVRDDLPGKPSCPANTSFRRDAQLRTNLARGEARFQLVEHLLAALYAMEIDNCAVEVDSEELPGLDGSSLPFVEALQNAGLIIQAREKQRLEITKPITIRDDDCWITAEPTNGGQAEYGYELSFDGDCPIENQKYKFVCSASRFAREVAPARTFVTQEQADALRAKGVGSHVTNQDLLVFGDDGPIDNPLRFQNECARHKTLDMVGDLALTGLQLVGRFTSYRGGHNLNGRMATQLMQIANQNAAGGTQDASISSFGNKRAA